MIFEDRRDAGRRLATELERFRPAEPVVIALPRGGVPVAAEVARALGVPLDLLVVRKLGAPDNPELAIGAIAEEGGGVVDATSARMVGATQEDVDATMRREAQEVRRRAARYRDGRPLADVRGRTVIVVDDGLATGLTMLAAVRALRRRGAGRLIVAVPVGAQDGVALLGTEADEVVCLHLPESFGAVGRFYHDFAAVPDEEVVRLASPPSHEVEIPAGDVVLRADLCVPDGARGLVLFAHGSGSGRHSPRNRAVAERLRAAGFATLLLDLLPEGEQRRDLVFDVELLGQRLEMATRWAAAEPATHGLPIALFGASTGAAAALLAAADLGDLVRAVVSRGGRPDLAGAALSAVSAPTLLIVGSRDEEVLELNRRAAALLAGPVRLAVVQAATHLFPEPGALEVVADLAAEWLGARLPGRTPSAASAAAR